MGRWIVIGVVAAISLGLGAGLGLLIHQMPVGLGLGGVLALGLAAAIGLPLGRLRWDRQGPLDGFPPEM